MLDGMNFCDGRPVPSIGARGATAWLPSAGYACVVHALGMYSPYDMELMEVVSSCSANNYDNDEPPD